MFSIAKIIAVYLQHKFTGDTHTLVDGLVVNPLQIGWCLFWLGRCNDEMSCGPPLQNCKQINVVKNTTCQNIHYTQTNTMKSNYRKFTL